MKIRMAVLVVVVALIACAAGSFALAASTGQKGMMNSMPHQSGHMGMGGMMMAEMGQGMMMGGGMGMGMGMGMMGGGTMQQGGNHPGMGMSLCNPRTQTKLGLSAEQKTKMKASCTSMERRSIQEQADMKIMRLDLMTMMDEQNPDVDKIDAKIDEMAKAHAEQMKLHLRSMYDRKNILTPEQQKKWTGMMESQRGGRDKMIRKDPPKKKTSKSVNMDKMKDSQKTQ